jgi:hypothetical protein
MTSMTVPQRINDFLAQRLERMYCDSCIQERLGLKWRQQVQLITATLAVTTAFRREFNTCCTCEEVKQVTHAVGSHSFAAVPATRSNGNAGQRRAKSAVHFAPGQALRDRFDDPGRLTSAVAAAGSIGE